jgi:hypothetical protein
MTEGTQNGERNQKLDDLYRRLVEEEDARVCKDIPSEACTEVPGNFFKIGGSQILTKLADELASAKTVLPWLLGSLGAPAFWIGFLVPIRESGSLLPQLAIAGAIRNRPIRKWVWVLGAGLQAAALLGMAATAFLLRGSAAGLAIVALLVLFSLARGLVSVASKDVTGKTVPKTRRGRLTGFTTAAAGLLTLALGAALAGLVPGDPPPEVTAVLLWRRRASGSWPPACSGRCGSSPGPRRVEETPSGRLSNAWTSSAPTSPSGGSYWSGPSSSPPPWRLPTTWPWPGRREPEEEAPWPSSSWPAAWPRP